MAGSKREGRGAAKRARLLVVGSRVIYRLGLAKLLQDQAGIRVLGTSDCTPEAIKEWRASKPDIILMDTVIPDDQWITVAKHINEVIPGARIVVLSHAMLKYNLRRAIRAGVKAYIDKFVTLEYLLRTISAVAGGEFVISPPIAAKLLKALSKMPKEAGGTNQRLDLSAREKEIIALISRGATNREIANQLFITESTVKVHLRNIMEKLQVSTRHKIAAIAMQKSIVS